MDFLLPLDCHNMSLKLVIDTDVGSDDAMALILCAAAEMQGQAHILGITCCHGNTGLDNVCMNTLKLLQTLNRLDVSYEVTLLKLQE